MGVHSLIVKMKSVSVKDVDQHKFVGLWPLSSKSPAKLSSPNGPTWSRQLSSRNLLLLMKTCSSFAWPPWSDTSTSDPPSESRRSNVSTEDTRTTVLPRLTSAPALDQLPAR